MAQPIAHYPATNIKVIIVGAGFGGLTAAIECHLKGHKPIVVEKTVEWKQLGDILSLGPNAGQILSRYSPEHIHQKMRPLCMDNDRFKIFSHTGNFITEQIVPQDPLKPMYNGHRAELHRVLYDYVLELGIEVRMGAKVLSYHEDKGKDFDAAWVELEDGEIIRGDLIVAANGLRSKAKKVVLQSHGFDIGTGEDRGAGGMWRERSTGYSVYRAWYDAEECGISKDPLTKFLTEKDTHVGWLGQDVHFLVASLKGGKEISWVATHPHSGDGEPIDDEVDGEDWMNPCPGRVEEAMELFNGWDPICKAIVSKTKSLIDFPLITRTPLPAFVSLQGQLCLLGDSAHPFLPTSIQGASQSMEDGVVLATSLSLSYFSPHQQNLSISERVSVATRVYERLRYERVKAAQATGVKVMEQWHKKGDEDWDAARKKPEKVELPRDEWLLGHDAEWWCRGVWDEMRRELEGGEKVPLEKLAAGPESIEVVGAKY